MPQVGQHGSKDAGEITFQPWEPLFHVGAVLGMLKGDTFSPQPFAHEQAQALEKQAVEGPAAQAAVEQDQAQMDLRKAVAKAQQQPATAGAPPAGGKYSSGPLPAPVTGGTGLGAKALAEAAKYLGIPYVYGGTDPKKGLDCSGFVQLVYRNLGIPLPRVTYDQVKSGTAIADRSQLRPGDLMFFVGDKAHVANGHVGIYVGNGMMIDAPYTGAQVGYRNINWNSVTAMRRVIQ